MRLELTRVGLQAELANHYTTRGAYVDGIMSHMALSGNTLESQYISTPTLWVYISKPSAQAGCDTRSIFKQSLTGLNSVFYFS